MQTHKGEKGDTDARPPMHIDRYIDRQTDRYTSFF